MSAGCGGGVAKAKMGDAPYDAQQGLYQKTYYTVHTFLFSVYSDFIVHTTKPILFDFFFYFVSFTLNFILNP